MRAAYPKSTISAAAFIKRHWDNCKLWPRESLLAWIQWYIDNDRFRGVKKDGKLVGVAAYRFVDSVEDISISEYRDTGGDLCYVALCVGIADDAMRAVYGLALDGGMRFCKKICFMRHKHSNRHSVYDLVKMNRRLGYG